jgi:hypothetical protein
MRGCEMEYVVLFLSLTLVLSVAVNVLFYYEIKQITAYWFSTVQKGQEVIERLAKVYPRESMNWTLKQPGVYVIKAQGWCKIGRATDVARRLHEHRTSIPRGFEIAAVLLTEDCVTLEASLHQKYGKYRKRGEWFSLPASAIEEIKGMEASYKGR